MQLGKLAHQFAVPTNFPAIANAFLDHGKTLVVTYSGSDDIEEWDIATGKRVCFWQGIKNWTSVCFSPDDRLCLTWRNDDAAVLRNLADGHETSLNLDAKQQASDVSFSPDGKLLAVTSMFGFAKVFDLVAQREAATLHGFLMGVHSVAFSDDGTRLALGSDGREAVKLWDLESLEELLTLGAEGSLFDSTQFSPDGNVLGSLNSAGELYLWRAPSWDEINAADAQEKAGIKQP